MHIDPIGVVFRLPERDRHFPRFRGRVKQRLSCVERGDLLTATSTEVITESDSFLGLGFHRKFGVSS